MYKFGHFNTPPLEALDDQRRGLVNQTPTFI